MSVVRKIATGIGLKSGSYAASVRIAVNDTKHAYSMQAKEKGQV